MDQEVNTKKKTTIDTNVAKSMNKKPEVKRSRKKKKNPLIPVLCLIMGILLGIIGAMLLMGEERGKDTTNRVESNETTEQQVTSQNTVEEMLKEEAFKIKTAYGDLYYPLKWEKQIRVNQVEGDVHTVQFFAKVEGKEEVHIFDIEFGGENGSLLGYVEEKNGEKVSINIISHDLELSEEWSTEEKNIIYAMLEDLNYIIGMLQKKDGVVLAN